jgi:hypothetical protein
VDYKIIIYVSRYNLSFYFNQNKGNYKLYEFENESLIPLCFYSEGTEFEIGYSAKHKTQNNYRNSYKDYFNLIKDTTSTFTFFTNKKKYKDFLVVGIEYLINKFFKEILMSSDNISSIRDSIDISFVFASNIETNEINFVGELFNTSGYKNLKLVYHNFLLLNYLDKHRKIAAYKQDKEKIGAYKGYLIIDGLNTDLYIDFYNELNTKGPKFKKIGKDLASNPKDKIIAKMLFDGAVLRSGSLVKEETELIQLMPLAKKYSSTTKLEPLITVQLSDGSVERVRLKMKKVNEILSYESNFTKDFDTVKECEIKSKITNLDLLVIVKQSITSVNFLDKLKSNYNNVFVCNEEIEDIFELFETHSNVISSGNFLDTSILKTVVSQPQDRPEDSVPKTPTVTIPKLPIAPVVPTNTGKGRSKTKGSKPKLPTAPTLPKDIGKVRSIPKNKPKLTPPPVLPTNIGTGRPTKNVKKNKPKLPTPPTLPNKMVKTKIKESKSVVNKPPLPPIKSKK